MNFYDEDANTTGPKWFEFKVNVTLLGFHLVQDLNYSAMDLQSYYENPYKWTEEYFELKKNSSLKKKEE
jgi:hypothetical protein